MPENWPKIGRQVDQDCGGSPQFSYRHTHRQLYTQLQPNYIALLCSKMTLPAKHYSIVKNAQKVRVIAFRCRNKIV